MGTPDRDILTDRLERAGRAIGRPGNEVVYTPEQLQARRDRGDSLVQSIDRGATIAVLSPRPTVTAVQLLGRGMLPEAGSRSGVSSHPAPVLPGGHEMPEALLTRSDDRAWGAVVFAGTRVPVEALFDHLKAGDPMDEFLAQYPSVTREQAVAVLEDAKRRVMGSAVEV